MGSSEGTAERKALRINPDALKVVPASQRDFWTRLADEVRVDVAQKFRKRWTMAETVRVVVAEPYETYEEVAEELGRTPGAVRMRRMQMVHLLRDEHRAQERVTAYREDPKTNHKFADYAQVDEALRELGYYDMPVSDQFRLAKPLRQPSASWRGDGTAAAVDRGPVPDQMREELQRLLRAVGEGAHPAPVSEGGDPSCDGSA